jgi:hypothetical protein
MGEFYWKDDVSTKRLHGGPIFLYLLSHISWMVQYVGGYFCHDGDAR